MEFLCSLHGETRCGVAKCRLFSQASALELFYLNSYLVVLCAVPCIAHKIESAEYRGKDRFNVFCLRNNARRFTTLRDGDEIA